MGMCRLALTACPCGVDGASDTTERFLLSFQGGKNVPQPFSSSAVEVLFSKGVSIRQRFPKTDSDFTILDFAVVK